MAGKSIVYRGITYTRHGKRRYYNPNGSVLAQGGTSLHRQMWLDADRAIPPGWHIHHIDGDLDHNELDNFACLPASDHLRLHYPARADLQDKLRDWRASPAGVGVLRDNARKMRERTPRRECACGNCGKPFETRHPRQLFCSVVCSEAAGFKQVEKDCPICGVRFWAKRSAKETQTCSYHCGWAIRRAKAGVQPDGG